MIVVDDAPKGPPLLYPTLDAFVEEFLVEMCWRDVSLSSAIWCPQWWRHPAAVVRLEAMWRAFEQLRQDPALGMSTWLRDHADYHMGVLTDPQGPFKGCDSRKDQGEEHDKFRDRYLPADAAPRGLFMAGD